MAPAQVRWSSLSSLSSLTGLTALSLIGLSYQETAATQLGATLAATRRLRSLVLGDARGLCFISDAALCGIGAVGGSLVDLDLAGCIELTDGGE